MKADSREKHEKNVTIYLALFTELVLPTEVDPLFDTFVTLLELLTLFVRLDCCAWYEFTGP